MLLTPTECFFAIGNAATLSRIRREQSHMHTYACLAISKVQTDVCSILRACPLRKIIAGFIRNALLYSLELFSDSRHFHSLPSLFLVLYFT